MNKLIAKSSLNAKPAIVGRNTFNAKASNNFIILNKEFNLTTNTTIWASCLYPFLNLVKVN